MVKILREYISEQKSFSKDINILDVAELYCRLLKIDVKFLNSRDINNSIVRIIDALLQV